MSSFFKIIFIHGLSLACLFLSDRAFGMDLVVDPKIITPVEGWVLKSASQDILKDKYGAAMEHFAKTPMLPVLIEALNFIESNPTKITNKNFLTLIDYSKNASLKRFYVIDLRSGEFNKYNVSNGRGSDSDHDGNAESFSNAMNSFKTSLGFYLTLESYYSDKFDSRALRLEGLSQTNSQALDRAIVIHGAQYMDPEKGIYGRSLGCPALDLGVAPEVISKIKNGSLIFAFK